MFNPFIIRMSSRRSDLRPWQHLIIGLAALVSAFLVFVFELGLKDAARVADTPLKVSAVVMLFFVYFGAKLYYSSQVVRSARMLMGWN